MKKKVLLIGVIALLVIGIVSLYSSFAYDEEAAKLGDSNANYNLIYSLKESSTKELSVASHDTVYVDITLTNTYSSTLKYGMYYKLINPNKMPNDVIVTLGEDSQSPLESTISANETKVVTIKVINNSEYGVELSIGALVGFENGNIEELISNNETLIK